MIRVQLIGKPHCHLCLQAESTIAQVCAELSVGWESLSIFDDPQLANRFAEFIPVTLVDGQVLEQFGISEARLRAALK